MENTPVKTRYLVAGMLGTFVWLAVYVSFVILGEYKGKVYRLGIIIWIAITCLTIVLIIKLRSRSSRRKSVR